MLRDVRGDVDAVAGSAAMVAIVHEESEHRDEDHRATQDEGEDRRAAITAGTVCHVCLPTELLQEQNEAFAAEVPPSDLQM